MFNINNMINPLISLILVVIVCSVIGIDKENIIIIVLISCIIVFLFKIILDINKYYSDRLNDLNNINRIGINNYIPNTVKTVNTLNTTNNTNTTNTTNTSNNLNKIKASNDLTFHLQNTEDHIIDANMYNLLDCTTEHTCIQKPDVNNLFVGFDKNIKNNLNKNNLNKNNINNNKKNNNNLNDINKTNLNNINTKPNNFKRTDEEIIENFDNGLNPNDLNDTTKPYNSTVINPYKTNSLVDFGNVPSESYFFNDELKSIEDISFHSRKGYCFGDICMKDTPKNEDLKKMKELSKKINNLSQSLNSSPHPHPLSDSFPTIRITNPETAL